MLGLPRRPRAVGEHRHPRLQPGRRLDRVVRRRHRVQPPLEARRRRRPDRRLGLREERAGALDPPRLQRLLDHHRALVEALARLVHLDGAEVGELPARQAAAHPEAHPPARHLVEQGDPLGDPQRVVPRHDHRRRAEVDVEVAPGDVGQQRHVVRAERVVEEVVLDGPHDVEAEVGGEQRQPGLLVVHLGIGDAVPALAGEDGLDPDVHGSTVGRHAPLDRGDQLRAQVARRR